MSSTEQQIKRIQDKLQLLLKQHAAVVKENQLLKDELGQVKSKTDQAQATIDNLQQQMDILKFSGGEMSDPEKKKFEKRINGYLKEIDRCIAMLGE